MNSQCRGPRRRSLDLMNTNAISHEGKAGRQLTSSPVLAVMLLGLLWGLPAKTHGADTPAAAGITEPFLDVVLSAPVPGIITVEKFKEGDLVKEGEVLLELDKKLEELETERRRVVRDQKRSDFEGTQRVFAKTPAVSKEDLDKKEVEYKVAAVEYNMALEQLRRRQLISPLSGAITEILLDVGESCQAYQPLVRVVETRRCYFVTNVDAKASAGLKMGQT